MPKEHVFTRRIEKNWQGRLSKNTAAQQAWAGIQLTGYLAYSHPAFFLSPEFGSSAQNCLFLVTFLNIFS